MVELSDLAATFIGWPPSLMMEEAPTIPELVGIKMSEAEIGLRLDASSNGILLAPEEFDNVTDYDDSFCYG